MSPMRSAPRACFVLLSATLLGHYEQQTISEEYKSELFRKLGALGSLLGMEDSKRYSKAIPAEIRTRGVDWFFLMPDILVS